MKDVSPGYVFEKEKTRERKKERKTRGREGLTTFPWLVRGGWGMAPLRWQRERVRGVPRKYVEVFSRTVFVSGWDYPATTSARLYFRTTSFFPCSSSDTLQCVFLWFIETIRDRDKANHFFFFLFFFFLPIFIILILRFLFIYWAISNSHVGVVNRVYSSLECQWTRIGDYFNEDVANYFGQVNNPIAYDFFNFLHSTLVRGFIRGLFNSPSGSSCTRMIWEICKHFSPVNWIDIYFFLQCPNIQRLSWQGILEIPNKKDEIRVGLYSFIRFLLLLIMIVNFWSNFPNYWDFGQNLQ